MHFTFASQPTQLNKLTGINTLPILLNLDYHAVTDFGRQTIYVLICMLYLNNNLNYVEPYLVYDKSRNEK